MPRPARIFPLVGCAAMLIAAPASAEPVTVYAAGSLRSLVSALTASAARTGIEIQTTFGGSGALRQKIEDGATPDMLLSADMASPAQLAKEGRTVRPPVAFARNRICLVASKALGLTQATMIDRLLADGTRIRTSKPVVDPAGDYAMAMFDRIDHIRPGAGAALRAKAAQGWTLATPTPRPGENATASLFLAGRIDVAVTYCSASREIEAADPDLIALPVPAALAPQPVLGLAILSNRPAVERLSALLLSRDGQALVDQAGLIALSAIPTPDAR